MPPSLQGNNKTLFEILAVQGGDSKELKNYPRENKFSRINRALNYNTVHLNKHEMWKKTFFHKSYCTRIHELNN